MVYFRQLFDEESATYTYLLADGESLRAVLIDPVADHTNLYLSLLDEQKLTLAFVLETHVHADHITAAEKLRRQTGACVAVGRACGAACADLQLNGDEVLTFGTESIFVLDTPGHTPGSVSYLWRDRLFTGDALLIDGCGRTDFQQGDAGVLYDSIVHKIWNLPDETLVYPGHDYHQRYVSSVAQEKRSNARVAGKSRDEFIALMQNLDMQQPRMMDRAVPANRQCGGQ